MFSDYVEMARQRASADTIALMATRIVELEEENNILLSLVEADRICSDDEADARECPLYDESEQYRCSKERAMRRLGLIDGDDD